MKFPKKEGLNEFQRVKLMINYQTSKTFGENLSLINEQVGTGGMLYPSTDRLEREKEEYTKETYPLYCKYPDKALVPINKEGVTGDESLVKSTGGTKFCLYRSQNKAGNEGIWIPSESEITFTSLRHIQYNADIIFEKYPDYMTKEELINNFIILFLPNGREVVNSFSVGSVLYSSRIFFDGGSKRWFFSGYKDKNRKEYPMPKWEDPRNEWDRFIDDFGTVIYFAIIIASMLIPGTQGGIIASVIVDLVASGVIAQRDLEKGNNISAVFSMLFALLPLVNLSTKWMGISDDMVRQLSLAFEKSNLNSKSNPKEWINFYLKLKPEQQLGLSKILKYDKPTIEKMGKEIAEKLGTKRGQQIAEILPSGTQKLIDADPNVLKSIPFLQRLGVKNLGLVGVMMLINYVLKKTKGEDWNDESKKIFTEVHSVISSELEELLFMNAIANAVSVNEIYDPKVKEAVEVAKSYLRSSLDDAAKRIASDTLVLSVVRERTEQEKGTWISEEEIQIEDTTEDVRELSPEQVEEYRKQNYIPVDEIDKYGVKDEEYDDNDILIINGESWIKKITKE